MAPTTTKQWTIAGRDGFESLKFVENAEIPKLGDHDVLVDFHYVSLNYRDLIIPMVRGPPHKIFSPNLKNSDTFPQGKYPFPAAPNVVPCSDGAGSVIAVGPRVSAFKEGDKVVTLFNQSHQDGAITADDTQTGLGGTLDGTLREYGVFEEKGLVKMPETLGFQEASTLSCAALTAWNGLYGLEERGLRPGDWVLTQGTGGVSMFALQVCPPPSFPQPS